MLAIKGAPKRRNELLIERLRAWWQGQWSRLGDLWRRGFRHRRCLRLGLGAYPSSLPGPPTLGNRLTES